MERLKGEGVQDWLSQHLTSPWHGHQTVASELGNDIIANIKERWSQLEGSVRLGVLFSLISLKKAQQLQLREKCQELIDHACSDPDDWVRLISQMLKDYPTEASLRFDVEHFADQAQLGFLMVNLTNHISRDGIKFHPKELAYLNESVCKASQGKDPKTKTYPPLTGPSLQQHFNLRDSHVSIHTERAEKLKKMAEQASPIVAMPALASPIGHTGSTRISPSNTPATAATANGSPGTTMQTPGLTPLGPPRPTKSSSTGLFVRKPAGSFLRNNAPRPVPLPRNPSVGQLPLRSPRIDSPTSSRPREVPGGGRVKFLEMNEGTEIMQSLQDEKKRKEEAEQREKQLKKEQRALELEAKRMQDAERKAQLLKEKEDKKREREEAKLSKEKQKQERDEQARKDREERQQKQEKGQDQGKDQIRETRPLPGEDDEDDDEEASLATLPARKRTRLSSGGNSRRGSRDGDDDYDNVQPDPSNGGEPMSPVTPSLNYRYSNHGIRDDGKSTPAGHPTGDNYPHPDSYFPQQQAQYSQDPPPQQQQPGSIQIDHPTIFQDINLLTAEDRAYIEAFLQGHSMKRPQENESLYQIVMNQELVYDALGKPMYETILIEMNFETGAWKKIKRRRAKPHVPTSSASSSSSSSSVPLQ